MSSEIITTFKQFQPCRGKINDRIYNKEHSKDIDNANSSRVQVEPNERNFVIIFSTVESKKSSSEKLSGANIYLQLQCRLVILKAELG